MKRTINDLNKDDFYSFYADRDNEIKVMGEISRMWVMGFIDKRDYDERVEGELSVDHNDILSDIEDDDYDRVLSCDKSGFIAHGTDEEMRFFVGIDVMAKWIDHLRSRDIAL